MPSIDWLSRWGSQTPCNSAPAEVAAGDAKRSDDMRRMTLDRLAQKMGVNPSEVRFVPATGHAGEPWAELQGPKKQGEPATIYASPSVLSDPDKQMNEWVLGHELSHAAHHDYKRRVWPLWLAAGALTAPVCVANPLVGVPCLVGAAVGATIVRNVAQETRADVESATKLNVARGGAEWAETMLQANRHKRETSDEDRQRFSPRGNNRGDWAHLPLSMRETLMEQLATWQEKSVQAPVQNPVPTGDVPARSTSSQFTSQRFEPDLFDVLTV